MGSKKTMKDKTYRVPWDSNIPLILRSIADITDANINNVGKDDEDGVYADLASLGDVMRAVKGNANPAVVARILAAIDHGND